MNYPAGERQRLLSQTGSLPSVYTTTEQSSSVDSPPLERATHSIQSRILANQQVQLILLGIASGAISRIYKAIVNCGLELIWKTLPEYTGHVPMVLCPAMFSLVLGYLSSVHQLDNANDMAHLMKNPWTTAILGTAVLWSGLNLGPEIVLIVLGRQLGNHIHLPHVGASSMVAGYYGLGGAIFACELSGGGNVAEHLLASCTSYLVHQALASTTITLTFAFPLAMNKEAPKFLVLVGIGAGILTGIAYIVGVGAIKYVMDDTFRSIVAASDRSSQAEQDEVNSIRQSLDLPPVIQEYESTATSRKGALRATRAALAGVLAGVVALYFPATMFWGHDQLQHVLNGHWTHPPIVGLYDGTLDSVAGLGLFAGAKIVHVGLSSSANLVGGQWWSPIVVAAPVGQILIQSLHLAPTYTSVLMVGVLGVAPVVVFRAYTGIALVLFFACDTIVQQMLAALCISANKIRKPSNTRC